MAVGSDRSENGWDVGAGNGLTPVTGVGGWWKRRADDPSGKRATPGRPPPFVAGYVELGAATKRALCRLK